MIFNFLKWIYIYKNVKFHELRYSLMYQNLMRAHIFFHWLIFAHAVYPIALRFHPLQIREYYIILFILDGQFCKVSIYV